MLGTFSRSDRQKIVDAYAVAAEPFSDDAVVISTSCDCGVVSDAGAVDEVAAGAIKSLQKNNSNSPFSIGMS